LAEAGNGGVSDGLRSDADLHSGIVVVEHVLRALKIALHHSPLSVGLTGKSESKMRNLRDHYLCVR
jgi:phosphoheptose isomerase